MTISRLHKHNLHQHSQISISLLVFTKPNKEKMEFRNVQVQKLSDAELANLVQKWH